jgi:hypothetical protein
VGDVYTVLRCSGPEQFRKRGHLWLRRSGSRRYRIFADQSEFRRCKFYVVTCLRRHLPAEDDAAVGMVEIWLLVVHGWRLVNAGVWSTVAAGLRGSARLYGRPWSRMSLRRGGGSLGLDAGFHRAADALVRGYVDAVLRTSLTAEICKTVSTQLSRGGAKRLSN